jgi:2,3-bisphosphoglycerate-independent phosphoglycerate mutase
MKKIIYVILDGAADSPQSALAEARTPYLDKIAKKGFCGIWTGPFAKNYNPRNMSSVATLELLGYSYADEPGRGYLEALGIGLKPGKNIIYLRANFATVKNKKIIDRRAGRDYSGLDALAGFLNKKINNIRGVKIKLYRSVGHRNVLALTGHGLNKNITENDTKENPPRIIAKSHNAIKTAVVLNKYIEQSNKLLSAHPINKQRILPANFLLVRGAGCAKKVLSFSKKFALHACSISGLGIIRGISRYVGIDVISPEVNQDLETNLTHRTNQAISCLKKYDLVIFHINGADTYAHDKQFTKKVKFLEMVDNQVFSKLIKMKNTNIAVISDHVTSSKTGEHVFGPVPFLIKTNKGNNNINRFNERTCKKGFVEKRPMQKVIRMVV